MKKLLCLLAAALLAGCTATDTEKENDVRLQLTRQMAPKWLESNIVPGKTTQAEVHHLFGNPLHENNSPAANQDTNSTPLVMWTYQGGWDYHGEHPIKFIVFSFTNDVVSGWQVTQNMN
jgi:hypothetical protein